MPIVEGRASAHAITAMKKKVLIVAGGTGGHIFPALAFGRWLLDQGEAESVVYMSGSRPLEAEIYASGGIEPFRLPLSGSPLGGGLWSAFGRCAGLFRSFFGTRFFLKRERPDVCFLFGGYVSLAPLLWCKWLGVPVIAHEQNACAGKVTRLAARMGVPVASGWSECSGVSNAFHVGVPVRSFKRLSRPDAVSALGVNVAPGDLVVGVIGGSLGSAQLSALVARVEKVGKKSGGAKRKIQFTEARSWDMAPFFSLCDAVVCRAGASTLAELTAFGIPALTIPWRGAADGHQEANAKIFSALTGNPVWVEGVHDEKNLEEAFEKLLERASNYQKPTGDLTNNTASSALWRLFQ